MKPTAFTSAPAGIALSLGCREVHCARDGVLRGPEDIHEELWTILRDGALVS